MDTNKIIEDSASISLVDDAAQASQFCTIWPNVKSGLTVLQGLVKNVAVKAVIGLVIGIGDAVSSKICG